MKLMVCSKCVFSQFDIWKYSASNGFPHKPTFKVRASEYGKYVHTARSGVDLLVAYKLLSVLYFRSPRICSIINHFYLNRSLNLLHPFIIHHSQRTILLPFLKIPYQGRRIITAELGLMVNILWAKGFGSQRLKGSWQHLLMLLLSIAIPQIDAYQRRDWHGMMTTATLSSPSCVRLIWVSFFFTNSYINLRKHKQKDFEISNSGWALTCIIISDS